MIRLSSVTDATYAPYENICPISGHTQAVVTRTGKNFLKNTSTTQTIRGVTFTVNSDGTVTANGTASGDAQMAIPLDTPQAYEDFYFVGSSGIGDNQANAYMWDNTSGGRCKQWNGTTNSANSYDGTFKQVKVIQGHDVVMTLRVLSGTTVTNHVFTPMIVLPTETDATYEPYSGQQYTIDLNDTRYGGTLDVTTGTLINKSEYKTLSTSNWTRLYDNQCVYYTTDPSKAIGTNNIISDMFKTDINRSNSSISGSASTRGIYVRDDSCTTLEEFKTKYPTINVLFERATHQTVQLSANEVKTLLGQNNIWSDTGTVDVEYRADTKLYIKKLTGITG